MDEQGLPERPSVLGDADLPNASSRLIAIVVGVCLAAGLLLIVVLAFAIEELAGRAGSGLSGEPRQTLPVGVSQAIPPPDPRVANAALRGDPATAFGPNEYPTEAVRRGEQGRTVARLTVDRSGTTVRCVVTSSSGSASLDQATCRIALAKVRYRPARDAAGRPIESSATLPVRWVLPVDC